jgi:hypothetical protein
MVSGVLLCYSCKAELSRQRGKAEIAVCESLLLPDDSAGIDTSSAVEDMTWDVEDDLIEGKGEDTVLTVQQLKTQ